MPEEYLSEIVEVHTEEAEVVDLIQKNGGSRKM